MSRLANEHESDTKTALEVNSKWTPLNALLVGMEWFPNRAGGLNRYFYDEVHALPSVGIGGAAIVTAVEPGQTAPLALHAMSQSGAGLPERWRGVRAAHKDALPEHRDRLNTKFALYTYPWMRLVQRATPLVVNFHGPWADEMAAEAVGPKQRAVALIARQVERAVYRRATRLITLSEAFRDLAHARYGVPLERIRVVPGAADLPPFLAAPERAEARRRLGWPAERPILLAVRRLARRMGLEGLIEAFATVKQTHPDALLLIGGKGAIAGELQASIDARGLSENVRLLGFVPDADLPLAYAAADLTIVPTISLEGFGLITVESLAAGTPVLGTPVGGTPEILRGLEPSLLFDAATPEAIAARIGQALNGQISLPERAQCRAYADRFGWHSVAPKIRAVFEEAQAAVQTERA